MPVRTSGGRGRKTDSCRSRDSPEVTIARWTFFSGPKPGLENSACENKVYPTGGKQSFVLSMKNGLPYLSKDLFWMPMGDMAKHATLV